MLIRQDFSQCAPLPPRCFLELVMDSLTRAYCFLWDHKNEAHRINMTWKDISKAYNKNTFRTNLRKLNNEGLLSYEESDEGVSVELVGWDDVQEE